MVRMDDEVGRTKKGVLHMIELMVSIVVLLLVMCVIPEDHKVWKCFIGV